MALMGLRRQKEKGGYRIWRGGEPMCRILMGLLVGVTSVTFISSESSAQTKRIVSFAFTNEITYEPYVYAIRKGIVSSNTVEIKLLPTAIPALLQATGTKQFDLIETSPLGLATGNSRGLDARIAGTAGIVRGGRFVFVKKDSAIKDPAELKGKSMGVTAIASTLVAHIRAVLAKKYHLNASLENGDIRWADLPMPTLPSALERGQVDSAYLIHVPSLRSLNSPEFRVLVDMTKNFNSEFGVDPLTSVVGTYDSKIAEMQPALREAVSMLRASAAYAKSHSAEVLDAVAKEGNMSANDLKTVSQDWYEVRFTLTPDDRKMIQTILDVGQEEGLIQSYPPLEKFLWQ
jgi:NitT/TauT family transport system substrate-binding protein